MPPSDAGAPAVGAWDIAIDVSDNQGTIDWPAVAAAGIRIAFVKVMQSPEHAYPSGPRQLAGARAAGIVGVPYWFLPPVGDAEAAAREFARRAELGPGSPFALDWEGRAAQTCPAQIAEVIGEELALVAGRKPIGYWGLAGSTPAAPTALMDGWARWVPRYPVRGVNSWSALPAAIRANPLARWVRGPAPAALPEFGQYTAWGRVPGIAGLVDRSVAFFPSPESALAFLAPPNLGTYILDSLGIRRSHQRF